MLSTDFRPLHVASGDTPIMVVGDVHGQYTPAKKLIKEMAKAASGPTHLITLGDLIDKGPQSIKTLKAALTGKMADWANASQHTPLWGNHEIMMAEAMHALSREDFALRTKIWHNSDMRSFLDETGKHGSDRERLARVIDKLGAHNLSNLRNWKNSLEVEDVRFVHAGFCPDVGWTRGTSVPPSHLWRIQDGHTIKHERHWASVRKVFLHHHHRRDKVIFHGHSAPRRVYTHTFTHPSHLIFAFSNLKSHRRICLDGGSGKGRYVAGALIENGRYRLFVSPCEG